MKCLWLDYKISYTHTYIKRPSHFTIAINNEMPMLFSLWSLKFLRTFLVNFKLRFFFLQFHPPILSLVGIRLHEFCGLVTLTCVFFIIFLIYFLNFILRHLGWLRIGFHNFFYLLSMGLSQSHDLGHKSCGLVWLTQGFFVLFLIDYFLFTISSFNIRLIEN